MFKTDAPALLVWADRTPSSCAACHWTVSSSCVSHVPSSLCQWRSKGPLDADVQLYLGLMTGFLANSVAGSCPEYKQQHYIQGLRTTDTSWARAGLGAKEQQHGLCLRLKCSRCIRRVLWLPKSSSGNLWIANHGRIVPTTISLLFRKHFSLYYSVFTYFSLLFIPSSLPTTSSLTFF